MRRAAWAPARSLDLSVSRGLPGLTAARIHQPATWRGRSLKLLMIAQAQMPILSREAELNAEIETIAARLDLAEFGSAAFRSSTSGRHIIGFSVDGRLVVVAKIGPRTDSGLLAEIRATTATELAALTPRLLFSDSTKDRVVAAYAAFDGKPCFDLNTALEESVALANASWTHGDFAPWNVLTGSSGTLIVDWEHAFPTLVPMQDLSHFVYKIGRLLGRLTPADIDRLVSAENGLFAEYDRRLGRESSRSSRREFFMEFLAQQSPSTFGHEVARAVRS